MPLKEATREHWAGLLGLLVPWCSMEVSLANGPHGERRLQPSLGPLQTLGCVAACTNAAILHSLPVINSRFESAVILGYVIFSNANL